ncbi:MAG: transglutaminase domain-containing protein [Spirochaetales bacterium]|nr:transglutaminase domain-containing protein [Spirochaetales bacterium]
MNFRNSRAALFIFLIFFLPNMKTYGKDNFLIKKEFPKTYHIITRLTLSENTVKLENVKKFAVLLCLPLPSSNQYQEISNLEFSHGNIETFPETGDSYLRIESGELIKEIIVEYDVVTSKIYMDSQKAMKQNPYDTGSHLYKQYMEEDEEVREDSGHEKLIALSGKAVQNSKDCINIAKNALTGLQNELSWKNTGRFDTIDEIFRNRGGNCGAMSRVYRAVLYNKGIPSRYCTGYIISGKGQFSWHVWTEFYLEGYGWIPVDPSFYGTSGGDYFGFLDSGRIALNRGQNLTVKGLNGEQPGLHIFQKYAKYYRITGGSIKGKFAYTVTVSPRLVRDSGENKLYASSEYYTAMKDKICENINKRRLENNIPPVSGSELLDKIASEHLDKKINGKEHSFKSSFEKYGVDSRWYFYQYRIFSGYNRNLDIKIIDCFSDDILLSKYAGKIGIGYRYNPEKDQHHIYVIIAKLN